jgi:ABC-2 type transport system ATP-binding protein
VLAQQRRFCRRRDPRRVAAKAFQQKHGNFMIHIENLSKSFGLNKAVDGVTFSVERGEVLGFLGPNGAGKSTTMRMITGFLPSGGGRISVGDYDVAQSPLQAKRLMGYLPENAACYPDMSVHDFLCFAAEMRGMRGEEKKRAVQRVVELCFLTSVLHQQIDTLSKGYKHRTCLAQALIHDPDVLVMDEPTDGLDPNQKYEVRSLIREMGKTKAVIFSTHILEEVDAACSRAIIIDRGRIVANGTPAELKNMSELAGAVTIAAPGADANKLAALPAAGRIQPLEGCSLRIYPKEKTDSVALVRSIMELVRQEGWNIETLRTEEGHLDEVFRRITLPDTADTVAAARDTQTPA